MARFSSTSFRLLSPADIFSYIYIYMINTAFALSTLIISVIIIKDLCNNLIIMNKKRRPRSVRVVEELSSSADRNLFYWAPGPSGPSTGTTCIIYISLIGTFNVAIWYTQNIFFLIYSGTGRLVACSRSRDQPAEALKYRFIVTIRCDRNYLT